MYMQVVGCVCVPTSATAQMWKSETICGSLFSPPPCGPERSNSGLRAGQQAPLATEPLTGPW